LIGYLLGDGSCNGTQPGVTNASSEVLDDVARCAAAIGFTTRRRVKAGCSSAFQILNSNDPKGFRGARGRHGQLRKWMDRHELRGKSSYTKRIPQSLLSANAETIAHALA